MANPAGANIRAVATDLAESARAYLAATDALDIATIIDEAGGSPEDPYYLEYLSARARLREAVGEAAPLADEDDGEDE